MIKVKQNDFVCSTFHRTALLYLFFINNGEENKLTSAVDIAKVDICFLLASVPPSLLGFLRPRMGS